jgi:opacity protein-like surface antigen
MARLAALALLAALAMSAASSAAAQSDLLYGDWRQLRSNAGPCPTCKISIDGIDQLTVSANNGWSATVVASERNGQVAATGSGRWRGTKNPVDGTSFGIELELRGDRLHMTMRIDAGAAAPRIVRAVFERPWLGS